jgi:hypothetical protein
MLEFLRGKASDRKFRLFAVACCRQAWHLFVDERSRRAVETTERFVDGRATADEQWEAGKKAWAAMMDPAKELQRKWERVAFFRAALAAHDCAEWRPRRSYPVYFFEGEQAARGASFNTAMALTDKQTEHWESSEVILAKQAHLLRDISGNPFRPFPPIDPAWLAWHGGTLRQLALEIYNERAFDRLPILADALEDAGCDNAELLGHLRGPGHHVRGCWVVDLLLGLD